MGKQNKLHAAADEGNVEAINKLLQKRGWFGGAAYDVNCRDLDGWTPLHYSATRGHVEAARALVAAGADVGAKTDYGKTPLHHAADCGHVEVVRALVAAGAYVGAKDMFGETPLDEASTNEVRKALSAPPPQRPPAAFQPPPLAEAVPPGNRHRQVAQVPSPLPPAPPPSILAMYTGGPVTLPSPLAAGQVKGVLAALAAVGLQPAVELVGAAATCNPATLVKACVQLFQAVQVLVQKGQLCHERLQRAVARVAAIEPALRHLGQELHSSARHPSTPLAVVESLCGTLLLLLHVMAQVQDVHRRLQLLQGAGLLRRKLELIKAGGCEMELAALHDELRDCVNQLATVLGIAHFNQAAQLMRSREELRVAEWQQQNEADRARDLQKLEGLVVEAVGGVQALQQQLAEQRVELDGQVVGLQQVAEWLQRMQAGSALIVGHLQQLSSKVDGISDGVAGMHLDVAAVRDQVEQLVAILLPPKQGHLRRKRVPMDSLPDLALPRERIQVARDLDGALADAKRGAFGGVVQAVWAGHQVAVKVYNYTGLGMRDCREAVREAVLLCKANHPNIVRCYGVVYDPEAPAQDSMQGSLVMEWVEGGSLYDWLQDEQQDDLGLEGRVLVAVRVAEGMRHLGEKRLVHGDLKPQNILVTSMGATAGVPQVKICDFGLAAYTSTTMHSTRAPAQAAAYTLAYTSPERLADYRRTPQDDVYAFGILLYFIATGLTPFRTIPAALLEQAILKGARPDFEEWLEGQAAGGARREVAEAYCRLAQRCWAAEAGSRPTFEAVLGDLSGMVARLQELQ